VLQTLGGVHLAAYASFPLFLNFLAAHGDRNCVEVATDSKLTTGTGDQDDAVALAPNRNVTATALDVGELAVSRH